MSTRSVKLVALGAGLARCCPRPLGLAGVLAVRPPRDGDRPERPALTRTESGVHSRRVRLAVAEAESTLNSGVLLLCLLGGALVLLWPIYRRILSGLGTMFVIFGAGLLALFLAGGDVAAKQIAGFVGVGLMLRVVGGIRPAAFVRRHRRQRRQLA